MIELYNLGISEKTLKNMLEIYPALKDIETNEIKRKIKILEDVGCTRKQIINIIGSNAFYLDRLDEDIVELIFYLKKIGFNTLNILFDSNPNILQLDVFEIEEYINKRINRGYSLRNIIDILDSNPYLFNEI